MDDDEPSMRFHLGSASRRGYQSDLGQGQGGSSGSGGPYYEQFLGGSTRDGVQQQQQQQQYPTWSTYGSPQESLPAELRAAYNGWNVFGNNADFLFPPADPSPATSRFGYTDEYMTSLSQPESNSGSESGYANLSFSGSMDGLAPNVDLSRASEQGRDIYTDAMNSLQQEPQPSHSGSSQSFVMPSYDLFGSRDVLHDEEVASLTKVQPQPQLRTSPQTVQQKVQQHAAASEPPRHSPVVCGEPRPSYSEVAKNKLPPVHPQKNRKPKKEDPSISFKSDKVPTTGARPGSGEYIPQPSMVPHRKSRGGGKLPNHRVTKHVALEPRTIKPDSRYGLDTFDDFPGAGKDDRKNSNLPGSLPQSRKGSTSSVGSGSMSGSMSGIDDIPISGTTSYDEDAASIPVNVYDGPGPGPGVGTRFDVHKGDYVDGDSQGSKDDVKPPKTKPKDGGKIFFDPKRIFKNNIPNNQQKKGDRSGVLNNGKPSGLNRPGSSCYINNDLRDSSNSKETNREANHSGGSALSNEHPAGSAGSSQQKKVPPTRAENPASGAGYGGQPDGNVYYRGPGTASHTAPGRSRESETSRRKEIPTSAKTAEKLKKVPLSAQTTDRHIPGEWLLLMIWNWAVHFGMELLLLLWDFAKLLLKLALLLIVVGAHYVVLLCCKAWYLVQSKPWTRGAKRDSWSQSNSQMRYRSYGLKENITLPATGEEAMKRLLSCKGKDPYSILGLRSDASSDDIKKYYRKQAVLVHPDKNQQPGAEEAFKTLGHAFDLIGDPVKRSSYDAQRFEADEAQEAMHEFGDLLTKLHEKMQEAANMMRCDHCGGKHKRIFVDIPAYSARFCDRCNVRHPAKEGDVWAESSIFGFRWHYYACMEGKVYDITEWASCKSTFFKQMQSNAHQVMYRIHTGAGRQRQAGGRNEEAELEDFLNHLFNKSGGAHGAGTGGDNANCYQDFNSTSTKSSQPHCSGTSAQGAQPGQKKSRRRRRRH